MSICLARADAATRRDSNVIDFQTEHQLRESSVSTATTQHESLEAELELRRTLNSVPDELFEDGVENELSRAIPRLVARFGAAAVEAIARLYLGRMVPRDIMSEVLRWLGRVEDEATCEARFWFLIYCLRDDSPAVRSAAALGLASLEDVRAVPYLRREAGAESIGLLRCRLEKVANELGA